MPTNATNTRQYYYIDSRRQRQGPVEASLLPSLGVSQDSYVWTEGMRDWDMVKNIRDLDSVFHKIEPKPVDMSTNKGKCALNAQSDVIPSVGLGTFIEGYTNTRDRIINKKVLWMLLIPILGQIVIPLIILLTYIGKFFEAKHFVYLYEEGILWRRKRFLRAEDEVSIRYSDIGSVGVRKTRHYSSVYGIIKFYNVTETNLVIYDHDRHLLLSRSFNYQNEKEEDDKYNALGFAMNAILDVTQQLGIEWL